LISFPVSGRLSGGAFFFLWRSKQSKTNDQARARAAWASS
jgi:hypothetical protein